MTTPHVEKYGSVQVPTAVGAPGATLTTTCDPTITGLLADFKAIINTRCAAAWAAAMGLKSASGNVVDATYAHEATPAISKLTWTGNAMFMWRDKERVFQRTNVHDDIESTVKVAFVMRPLSIDDAQKYESIRTAVRTCLQGFVKFKGDPTCKPETLLSSYGLDSFTWTEFRYGYWDHEIDTTQIFAVLDCTALMREREEWVLSQYDALTRIDTTVSSNEGSASTDVLSDQFTPP